MGCTNAYEQDQFALITEMGNGKNNFGYASDEAGATATTAANLNFTTTSTSSTVDKNGVLTKNDVDLYKFTTTGGNINFIIKPIVPFGKLQGNADFKVRLLNSNMVVLSESNPIGVRYAAVEKDGAVTGTYYLEISSSGYLDFSQLGGYSQTVSLGNYQIMGGVYGGVVDDIPPTVSMTSPINGSSYTSPAYITVSANASDNRQLDRVQFFYNSSPSVVFYSAPYTMTYYVGEAPATARAGNDERGAR